MNDVIMEDRFDEAKETIGQALVKILIDLISVA
jgi:hypothetical protein